MTKTGQLSIKCNGLHVGEFFFTGDATAVTIGEEMLPERFCSETCAQLWVASRQGISLL